MYTILVNDDNSLVTTSKERIMQRSKLVDTLWFLVPKEYKGHDMTQFTVMLEYLRPVSREYKSEVLTRANELHNEHLKYTLPFDTCLTSEPGNVEVQLTFVMVDIDENGYPIQRVRKTSPTIVTIIPISAWSDIIPDSALTAIDQRLIKADAQIRALNESAELLNSTKADNVKYDRDSGELRLTADGRDIGDSVFIIGSGGSDADIDDGLPVILF